MVRRLLILFYVAIPLVPLLFVSLSMFAAWPGIAFDRIDGEAWMDVLANEQTWRALMNSILLAFTVTVVNLMVAWPAADALSRRRLLGRKWLLGALYLPLVVPVFVALLGLHVQYINWGLTDTWTGVLLAHLPLTLPYMLRSLMVGFRTLGFEWEEQARTLGASPFQRLRYVVWPHLAPAIYAGSVLSILVSMSQYLITLIIGGGQTVTFTLLMFPYANGGQAAFGAVYVLLFALALGWSLWLCKWTVTQMTRRSRSL